MVVYGYARVSTKTQSIERQQKNITEAFPEVTRIYSEAYTGTTSDRPEWQKLLKHIKPGDTLVFDSVSRMSRNAAEGITEYHRLDDMGVNLVFLKEPHISTAEYHAAAAQTVSMTGNEIADIYLAATNKVLRILADRQIELAFGQAEKEVTDLHQRTREGMAASGAAAKISETRTGAKYETPKAREAKDIIRKHYKKCGGTLTREETMEVAHISRATFQRYWVEMQEERE